MGLPTTQVEAIISAGNSLSAGTGLGPRFLSGIAMPAAWTTADLTFQVSVDGENFLEMVDVTGAAIGLKAAAGQFIAVDQTLWRGVGLIKIRSGTLAAPVVQTADRTLTFILV